MSQARKIAPKYLVFAFVLPVMLFLDLWTKQIVVDNYEFRESTVVVPEFFSITYARNYGAAFSMFRDLSKEVREIFFGCVTLIAVGTIAWFLIKLHDRDLWLAGGLAGILSGALGNSVNRFQYGYVVDFLDFYWGKGGPTWPTFNVADIGISVGAVMIFAFELFRKDEGASVAPVAEPAGAE